LQSRNRSQRASVSALQPCPRYSSTPTKRLQWPFASSKTLPATLRSSPHRACSHRPKRTLGRPSCPSSMQPVKASRSARWRSLTGTAWRSCTRGSRTWKRECFFRSLFLQRLFPKQLVLLMRSYGLSSGILWLLSPERLLSWAASCFGVLLFPVRIHTKLSVDR
jgi:hypothetical protein